MPVGHEFELMYGEGGLGIIIDLQPYPRRIPTDETEMNTARRRSCAQWIRLSRGNPDHRLFHYDRSILRNIPANYSDEGVSRLGVQPVARLGDRFDLVVGKVTFNRLSVRGFYVA